MTNLRRSRRLQGLEPQDESEQFTITENIDDSQPIWSLVLLSVAIASIPVFFAIAH